jgi:hypothetical protein
LALQNRSFAKKNVKYVNSLPMIRKRRPAAEFDKIGSGLAAEFGDTH